MIKGWEVWREDRRKDELGVEERKGEQRLSIRRAGSAQSGR
jgi:hypothetical protein